MSGRGPGFPLAPSLPSRFTNHHLTSLRQVAYDPSIATLVSNPVAELVNLRNATLASERGLLLAPSKPHVVAGTGWGGDASTSDIVISMSIPAMAPAAVAHSAGGSSAVQTHSAVGVRVLANVTDDGTPFGGILAVVNFTDRDANGTMHAIASVRTLDPCGLGSGSSALSTATFPILPNETTLDLRLLVECAQPSRRRPRPCRPPIGHNDCRVPFLAQPSHIGPTMHPNLAWS